MKDKVREYFLKDKEKDEPFIDWILRKRIELYVDTLLSGGSEKKLEMIMRKIEEQMNWIETVTWHVKNNLPIYEK